MDAIIGTGKISKRQYGVRVQRNVAIPTEDGFNIDADLFLPDSSDKFPALMSLSPYSKELQSDRLWPRAMATTIVRGSRDSVIEAGPTDFFVRRGYAHIIGSVRGTGKSGGIYRYISSGEMHDIFDVIEWVARQPWCNGNVGMLGCSYFGWIQQPVAALQPPHLKAICPFYAATDHYRDAWYHGGILKHMFLNIFASAGSLDLHSASIVALEELGEEGLREAINRTLKNEDITAEPGLMAALENFDTPVNAAKVDILLHPEDGPYWQERLVDFDKIKIPTYLGCCWGMYELHLPGTFRSWENLKVPKKMVIGPPIYLDRPIYQYQWEMLRWYDYWLKGIDTGIMEEPPVRIFVTGTGDWKSAEDWPIPGTRWIPFNLHSGGILCEIEPWSEAPSASYEDAPGNRGSLTYRSPKLVENTEIAGPMALYLYASCRGTDINFFISLWDIDPEGNEAVLTRGWLKGSHRELDAVKSKPWRPFHTHTNPRALVPGEVYQFAIEIIPTAHLFKSGHQIGLKIKGAADEPPKTMLQAIHTPHLPSQIPNVITIYHDVQRPSHLLLPITRGNIIGTFLSGGDISLREPKLI